MVQCAARARNRTVMFVVTPALWPAWPFLPVIRRRGGIEELGVMLDARGVCGFTGLSATVYFTNVFCLPATLNEFLTLPHETFDTAEELTAAGWRVD